MQMSKNVINDISEDPPIHQAHTTPCKEQTNVQMNQLSSNVTGILNTTRISIVKVIVDSESNMRGVLNTARISIVEAIMSSDK